MTINELASMPTFWIFLVIGIVGIVGAIRVGRLPKKQKKVGGFNKGMALTFLVIVGLGGLYLSDIGSLTNQAILESPLTAAPGVPTQPLAAGDTGTQTITPSTTCAPGQQVEDTTVTLSGVNKYTAAASGGTHRYKVNGAPALTVSDAGTFTASPGDNLQILWMNGSETQGSYFSKVTNEVVPCAGTKTFTTELVANSSITIEVFNEEGNLIARAENETLANGDVVTLDARLKGTYQYGFPYGGVIVAEYYKDYFDDVVVDFGGAKVGTPDFYSVQNATYSTKTYEVPAVMSNDKLSGSIVIDVDDTNNPTGADHLAVNLTYYPKDYFINTDTGASFDGPAIQDEDDSQTKRYSLAYPIYVD